MGEPIRIFDVVGILGLDPRPGSQIASTSSSVNFKCPICNHKGYTLNVNCQKDTFKCPKCNSKGGAVALYSLVRFNEPYQKGSARAKETIAQLRQELYGDSTPTGPRRHVRSTTPAAPVIRQASDEEKNAVYNALLDLEPFKLTPEHRDHLRSRGLSDAVIDRNQYRSIPDSPYQHPRFSKETEAAIQNLPVKVSKSAIALGLMTVAALKEKGFTDFTGIPGFFKVGKHWCFYLVKGILIPTRNERGQIVCFQVRRQGSGLRYMTLSNKMLPGSVQDGISKCHVVSSSRVGGDLTCSTRIMLTEGPLKADVIAALSNEPVLVLAIQGVNVTSCLKPILDWLKASGVRTIYNCLDMDRITNLNVRAGSLALRELMAANGFLFPAMVWDDETAIKKLQELKDLAIVNQVPLPIKTGNPFTYLCSLCVALEEAGIQHTEKSNYWPSRSKGYDDWLYFIRSH